MLPKYHITLGIFFALIILIIFPQITLLGAFIIFLSSVLLDLDHYTYYVLKYKDLSFKKSFLWFMDVHNNKKLEAFEKKNYDKNIKGPFHPLHTIEFLILIFIFSLFLPILSLILLGMLFHHFVDIIDLYYQKAFHFREFSTILYFLRKNNKTWKYY